MESNNDGSVDLNNKQSVISRLRLADDAYTNSGTPIMSDSEYDTLRAFAQSKWPEDPYFEQVGSQVRGGKIDLPAPMPSLDQVQIGDFATWLQTNGLERKALVVTKKLDGVSVLLQYSKAGKFLRAYSRGDGLQGADITRHVQHLEFPKQIHTAFIDSLLIRGEIMCNQRGFNAINAISAEIGGRVYANPRNTIAGLLNSSIIDSRMYEHMTLFVYQAIGSKQIYNELYDSLRVAGFRLPLRHTITDPTEAELAEILMEYKTGRYDGFECDGLVIYVDSHDIRKVLDFQCEPGDNPKSAIKYKINENAGGVPTKVVDVEFNVSKDGFLKPTVVFDPIVLNGATVTKATGFNAKFIRDNQIGPGAIIRVVRSGMVIPYIVGVDVPML